MRTIGRRLLAILAALALSTAWGLATAGSRVARPDPRPNVVVILTDDQTAESLPHDPPVMPYLQARMQDPADHWVTFPYAFVNTPMCCPSRVTILTGLFPGHTGVRTNDDGGSFDESSSLATWLHGAGYFTGLVGKYLNGYPFGRGPYVPPGWDRWTARRQSDHLYFGYALIEQDLAVRHGLAPDEYLTDVLADRAVGFIRSAPPDRPFFLMFAPTAPHRPPIPAPRYETAEVPPPPEPPGLGESDVSDKPGWVRSLPPLSDEDRAALAEGRREEYRTLLGVDDAVRRIVEALAARGELDRTVIFFLTDNGIAYGEHRWTFKACPYDACTKTPFLVRMPASEAREPTALASTVDLAPTIADLAGVEPPVPFDGVSLLPALEGDGDIGRAAAPMEWVGGSGVPAWRAVRTRDFLYVELATGERELYDLTGRLGPPDPYELRNLAGEPAAARTERRLDLLLARLGGG